MKLWIKYMYKMGPSKLRFRKDRFDKYRTFYYKGYNSGDISAQEFINRISESNIKNGKQNER